MAERPVGANLPVICYKSAVISPIQSDPIQASIISVIFTITFKNPANSQTIFDNDHHCRSTRGKADDCD